MTVEISTLHHCERLQMVENGTAELISREKYPRVLTGCSSHGLQKVLHILGSLQARNPGLTALSSAHSNRVLFSAPS